MKKLLQFSGGKDSLATLLLLEKEVKSGEIAVAWANTGDCFPEMHEQMEKVRLFCRTFIEVKGYQNEVIRDFGYPSDVISANSHDATQRLFGAKSDVKLQSGLECCFRSHISPMAEFVKNNGFSVVYRGQKKQDVLKGSLSSGDVVDGVEYIYPIENWSDNEVMQFIKDSELLSSHYSYQDVNTSMDCIHCTAFLAENKWKYSYLKEKHKDAFVEVQKRFDIIKSEIFKDIKNLDYVMGV